MRKTFVLLFMATLVMLSLAGALIAQAIGEPPAQYCKVAAPPQFFNACTVCAAQGSPGPIGDTRTCACKTIMSGFFGTPPYKSFGECMRDWK